MTNILIVEGETDKYFLDAYINFLNFNQLQIETTAVCRIDDFECMSGESITKISAALQAIANRSRKEEIGKIGLILDQDDKTDAQKIEKINEALKSAFGEDIDMIENIGAFISIPVDEDISLDFGAYFLNVNGVGNLETILKTIHNQDATFANCLNAWGDCLSDNDKRIKQSAFDKFWVQVYIRYDACSKKEQKQAGRKCNSEVSMSKPIWNFEHECLATLKTFLTKFQ